MRIASKAILALSIQYASAVPLHAQVGLEERIGVLSLEAGLSPAGLSAGEAPAFPGPDVVPAPLGKQPAGMKAAVAPSSRRIVQSTEGTPFYHLGVLFSAAGFPSPDDVRGWFAGRCYRRDDPYTPLGALVSGVERLTRDGNGPLFPPAMEMRLVGLLDKAPEYFDDPTKEGAAEISTRLDRIFKWYSPAAARDGGLTSTYEWGNLESRVRKQGDYLIEAAFLLRDMEPMKAGEVGFMCYYFKKVR